MSKEVKNKLVQCMECLLTKFETNSSTSHKKTKTCDCHQTIGDEILQNIFEKKVNEFQRLCQENGVWETIVNKTWVYTNNCDCPKSNNSCMDGICQFDYIWHFVKLILQTLLVVHSVIEDNEITGNPFQNKLQHQPNVLGVKDLKFVSGLIQLVVTYGVWPCLNKGIGKALSCSLPSEMIPYKTVNDNKLFLIVKALLTLISNKEFCVEIAPLVTGDVLASLIQLGNKPLKQKCTDKMHQICKHKRNSSKRDLMEFINKGYQPLLIKELLTLQRCAMISRESNIKWFIRCVGEQLTLCLVMTNGVFNTIQAILDGLPDKLQWVHYESMGNVIARVPQKMMSSPNDYYSKVMPQLSTLLKNDVNNEKYVLAGIASVIQIFEKNYNAGQSFLIDGLSKPLKNFINTDSVTIDIVSLSSCVTKLHNLICTNESVISEEMFSLIAEWLIQSLFMIYTVPIDIFIPLRVTVGEVIISTLQNIPSDSSIDAIFLWMFSKLKTRKNSFQSVSSWLVIAYDTNETSTGRSIFKLSDLHTEERISKFLEIMQSDKLKSQQGDVFIALLEEMIKVLENNKGESPEAKIQFAGRKTDHTLLEVDQRFEYLKYSIEIVSTVSAMIDSFGCSILQNTPQIISFVKEILNWSQNNDLGDFNVVLRDNTVDLGLMLLSTLLGSNQLSHSDFDILSTLIPSLDKTSRCHGNASSKAMATDIKTFISTRGSVNNSYRQRNASDERKIEDDYQSKECYEKALEDLLDPLIPTRGHALRQLSKLLKLRNPFAVENETNLLEIFETNLTHDDTYVYLAAVDGLISLVDVHHRTVMPLLCRRFIDMKTKELDTTASHNRMKLCEAIIRSCHICGEMLPPYKEILMAAFSCGVRDEDEMIRASSLSGVGDLCYLLKFSLGVLIEEIVSCICHVVSTDTSAEVRRAGVRVVSQILKGLDVSILETLPHHLKELYNVIKFVKSTDLDETVQWHADNALGILAGIVKDLMQPKSLIAPIHI